MNRKAQMEIGGLILVAVVAIVGLVLMVGSAQNLETYRNTYDVANESRSSANGTTGTTITACQAWRNVVVYNQTPVLIGSGNYSVTNYQVSDGALTVLWNVSADALYQDMNWNVSYTCEPFGYDTSSGGRAIGGMIILVFALAIALVVIFHVMKNDMIRGALRR